MLYVILSDTKHHFGGKVHLLMFVFVLMMKQKFFFKDCLDCKRYPQTALISCVYWEYDSIMMRIAMHKSRCDTYHDISRDSTWDNIFYYSAFNYSAFISLSFCKVND